MSWTELGHQTGLSTSAVQQRVKRLEAKGIITGYHATLNLEAIGAGITAFIFLNPIDPEEDETIPGILRTFPEVRGCHSIAGAASYLARVQAPSAGHLAQLLTRIRKDCLCGTETVLALDTMFEDLGIRGTRRSSAGGAMSNREGVRAIRSQSPLAASIARQQPARDPATNSTVTPIKSSGMRCALRPQ